MRRTLAFLLVLAAMAAVLGGVVATNMVPMAGLPANAQSALERYLRYQQIRAAPTLSVAQEQHASRPWNLTPAMSGATYSDGPYFQTSHDYEPDGQAGIPLSATVPLSPTGLLARGGSLRALPYPPTDLWCVLLRRGSEPGVIVLLALHTDLYGAEWVVHEGVAAPDGVGASLLAALGCQRLASAAPR
jgi:hypothetical protein